MTTAFAPWPRPKPTSAWDRATRSLVHRSGRRFRTNLPVMHGVRTNGQGAFCTPDLTFSTQKLAVFLDGCYWHGCPTHYPSRAKPYDRIIDTGLASRAWTVLRIWECVGAEAAAQAIYTSTPGRAAA